MGLFSKARQAQDQMEAFGLGGGAAGQQAYAQLAQKLYHSGVQASAVVNAVRPTGQTDFGGSPEIDFDVTITKPTGEAYATTIRQGISAAQVDEIRQGATVTVRYDPDNPAAAMIYGW